MKKVTYNVASLSVLKRAITWAVALSVLILGVLAFQIWLMLDAKKVGYDFNLLELVSSIVCLAFCGMFILYQLMQIIMNTILIKRIHKESSFEAKNINLLFVNDNSSGKFYRIFLNILFSTSVVALAGFLTFSICDYFMNHNINYILPLIISLFLCCFHSLKAYEVNTELKKTFFN